MAKVYRPSAGKKLPKGAGAVVCNECGDVARADGKGSPIVLKHKKTCSERKPKAAFGSFLDGLPAEKKPKQKIPQQRAAKSSPETNAKASKAERPAEGTGPKASAFVVDAKGLGWDAVVVSSGDAIRSDHVTVSRGEVEQITIEWQNECQVPPVLYTRPDGSVIKLNNASAARKKMAEAPPSAAVLAAKARTRASINGTKSTVPVALPFEPGLMTDEELAEAMRGTRITWVNAISGAEDTDSIPPDTKVRVTEGKSGRQLHFIGIMGARSVRVSSIIAISGAKRKKAKS